MPGACMGTCPLGEFWNESWFWPSATVIVGLPIALLTLTEVIAALERSGSAAAKIVRLIRNYVLPVAALWLLLTQTGQVDVELNWAKVTATVLGFLVILVLLNGLNFAVFVTARSGSWRSRLPSIFVDIARVLLIVVSVAILFSVVWGADVGGLFAALGIGSIVIGLALQNSVGSVISGLLLLFEQPFKIGDWLRTSAGKGRVVEVNWRAVHIDTANGIRIIPNAELAGEAFVNLSRATNPYETSTIVRFGTDDPPAQVMELLVRVALDLPGLAPGGMPYVAPLDKARYEVNIPLANPGVEYGSLALFRRRLWYAGRRANLHLDRDLTDNFATPQRTRAELERLAPSLHLAPNQIASLLGEVELEQYCEGEVVQRKFEPPDGVRFILSGRALMWASTEEGKVIPVVEFGRDDAVGLTSLTRQGIASTVTATTELAVLFVPVETLDRLVHDSPALARDYGREIDNRRNLAFEAFQRAGEVPPSGSPLIAY